MSSKFTSTTSTLLQKRSSALVCPSYHVRVALFSLNPQIQLWPRHAKSPCLPTLPRISSRAASLISGNAAKTIPLPFRDLRSSLSDLDRYASIYINLNRLHLALHSLESENAVIRIAVLSIHGQKEARRLLRALLADPLKPESSWEKQLALVDEESGKGLVLRYRDQVDFDQRHPLIQTLSIPSPILLANKLEILVQSVPSSSLKNIRNPHDLLVPTLRRTDTMAHSNLSLSYPVHKTIVIGNGLQDLASLSSLIPSKDTKHADNQCLKAVVDGSWDNVPGGSSSAQLPSLIDLQAFEDALQSFRMSLDMAVEFEHTRSESGIADTAAWFFYGTTAGDSAIKPCLSHLIETIIGDAELAIKDEEQRQKQQFASSAVPSSVRKVLLADIAVWAESAHSELRYQLDYAFNTRDWRRLKWWNLIWRVDDVSYIAANILQQMWLVESEKDMIWLSGKIEQAGLDNGEKFVMRASPNPGSKLSGHRIGSLPTVRLSDAAAQVAGEREFESAPFQYMHRPWSQTISHARLSQSRQSIPKLQTLAQRILLQSISTTLLTSSLSILLYVSSVSRSFYEAGAIAAVGLVVSLRMLQRRWGSALVHWEADVREEGRSVLRRAEERLTKQVNDGGMGSVDERAVEDGRVAKEAVKKAKESLKNIV